MVDKEPLGGVVGPKCFGLCLYVDEAAPELLLQAVQSLQVG